MLSSRLRALKASEMERELTGLLRRLGVELSAELLELALSHRSYVFEHKRSHVQSNERLEFLGDAVLGLATAARLYRIFPDRSEGELAKIRSAVVCETTLARKARDLGLGSYLLLGHGEEQSGGRMRSSLLADALEAVIGAIYLDLGYEAASKWITRLLGDEMIQAASGDGLDYKSRLQEKIQHTHRQAPTYELLSQRGPDHAKFFRVGVKLQGQVLGTGEGSSKKEAEQLAARSALVELGLMD